MSGILASLMERRFHVSQSPPGWVEKTFGRETATGVPVDESSALQYIAVFSCIRILSESLASLPLITYRWLKKGGKERAPDFSLYSILRRLVNPEMTAYKFKETMMGHLVGWGNAYAQIIWNGAGQVIELWPLRPDKMKVKRDHGQLQYIYTLPEPDPNGKLERTFSANEIFHLKGLGFDGLIGYSPIAVARQAIGLGLAAEEFGSRFFGNDARPGFVLKHPAALSEQAYERLKKSQEEEHGGVSKSHRPQILEEGMDIKEIGLPPEDAQFLQTRTFQLREMARLYRVPPHMLADLERATFNNVEELSQEFVDYTLRPWATNWEDTITLSLLTPAERQTYFSEFLLDALLRGNIVNRYQGYHTARMDGWMNADEIREKENMNPLPKGQGQVYLVPLNMIPAGQVQPQRTRNHQAISQASTAMRGLYLDTIGRILRREKNDLNMAAKKYLAHNDFGSFLNWMDEFYRDHVDFIVRQLKPLAESHAEALLPGGLGNMAFINQFLDDYALRHVESSQKEVKEVVLRSENSQNLSLCADLEAKLEGWIGMRAAQIAERESLNFGDAMMESVEEGTYEPN